VNEILTAMRQTTKQVKVVSLTVPVEGFFLIPSIFSQKLLTIWHIFLMGPKDCILARELAAERCICRTIASIRGRATGMGSDVPLPGDIAFRESRRQKESHLSQLVEVCAVWCLAVPHGATVAPHGERDAPWKLIL